MRRLTISGNLGQKPELRTTNSGVEVAELRVATNERVKRNGEWVDETEWVSVPVFGNRAKAVSGLLDKGDFVVADGQLEVQRYQKKDGTEGTKIALRNGDVKWGMLRNSAPHGNEQSSDLGDDQIPF